MSDAPAGSPQADPPQAQRGRRAHTPRPSDLVALVTFDGEVYENQAVTRERLARPSSAPHPFNAAIEQWLGGRRRTWIDVRGRQINGIATARELSSDRAWLIDTLVDASTAPAQGVVAALLRQAIEAATQHRVTHVLLRTAADGPALADALRAGFKPALVEQLWSGSPPARDTSSRPQATVREDGDEDAFALFQLYNRALPIEGRQALALTFEQWQAIQERRWLGRGSHGYVAVDGTDSRGRNRVCAALRVAPAGETGQFDLLADADGLDGAAALLDLAAERLADARQVLALVPCCAAPLERLLRERGLQPGAEYTLLSRQTAKPVSARSRVAPGVVVSRGA